MLRTSMKVVLAGYNIDAEVIADLKRNSLPRADITPETLSASYARISRHPEPANELRARARREVERARRSNQAVIFKMGHHSVAEHAVFNFDIIGVSRLAIEELERFRLCSFTEKSQRYIKLGDDFVIPDEICRAGKEAVFLKTVRLQNSAYHRLYEKLRLYFLAKFAEMARNPRNHSILDGWAKEDARYVVSLATQGQLGMTINARNLEFMIRRFASKSLEEIKELRSKLYSRVKNVAPSIILFTEAGGIDKKSYGELKSKACEYWGESDFALHGEKALALPAGSAAVFRDVRLADFTPEADAKILAALLHTVLGLDYRSALARVRRLIPHQKRGLMKKAFEFMEFYDFPLREFEYADLTFDLIVSAACFAQLKRHRMATLTVQAYDPALGVTLPPSIEETGMARDFMSVIRRTNAAYEELKASAGEAASYVLTNAHRRRALLKVNAREMYHISRLREDATAQWDIRRLTAEMSRLARKAMPLTFLLVGGKDAYPAIYKQVFGRPPKQMPPPFCS